MEHKEITDTLAQLHQIAVVPNREGTSFAGKFGNCKESFEAIFKTYDKPSNFVHYEFYDEVIDWLTDNKGRGLALFGSVGTGKSVILRGVLPVYFRHYLQKHLRVLGPIDFATMDPREDITPLFKRWAVAIDEFGREPLFNNFGERYELAPLLIEQCEIHSKLLFLTSNMNEKQIIERYGIHTWDRIKKQCRVVVAQGKSSRG